MQLASHHQVPQSQSQSSELQEGELPASHGKLSGGAIKMGSRLFKSLDLDNDGFISRIHLPSLINQIFANDNLTPPSMDQIRSLISEDQSDYSQILSKKSFKKLLLDLSSLPHGSKNAPSNLSQINEQPFIPGTNLVAPSHHHGQQSDILATQIQQGNFKQPLQGSTSQASYQNVPYAQQYEQRLHQNQNQHVQAPSSFDRSFGIENNKERQQFQQGSNFFTSPGQGIDQQANEQTLFRQRQAQNQPQFSQQEEQLEAEPMPLASEINVPESKVRTPIVQPLSYQMLHTHIEGQVQQSPGNHQKTKTIITRTEEIHIQVDPRSQKLYQNVLASPNISGQQGRRFALSREAIKASIQLFNRYDQDKDGLIDMVELGNLIQAVYASEGSRSPDVPTIALLLNKYHFFTDHKMNYTEFKRLIKELAGLKVYDRFTISAPRAMENIRMSPQVSLKENLPEYAFWLTQEIPQNFTQRKHPLSRDAVRNAKIILENHDLERTGYIDFNELESAIKEIYQLDGQAPPSREDILFLLNKYDKRHKHRLSRKEFRRMLKELAGIKEYDKQSFAYNEKTRKVLKY